MMLLFDNSNDDDSDSSLSSSSNSSISSAALKDGKGNPSVDFQEGTKQQMMIATLPVRKLSNYSELRQGQQKEVLRLLGLRSKSQISHSKNLSQRNTFLKSQ